MDLHTYLLFLPIALISICSPGPATLLAISNSLNHGFARVHYSTLGNVLGQLIVASLAMLGVGAILNTSMLLFELVKTCGACYLIYLGIKQWRGQVSLTIAQSNPAGHQVSNWNIALKGFVLALSNPKDIFFFTALLPQFIQIDQALLSQFSILVASFMGFSYVSLMSWAYAAHSAKGWLTHQGRMRWFNRITGGMFIALGLGMLRLKRHAQ